MKRFYIPATQDVDAEDVTDEFAEMVDEDYPGGVVELLWLCWKRLDSYQRNDVLEDMAGDA